MNEDDKINKLNELLPRLSQHDRLCVLSEIATLQQSVDGEPVEEVLMSGLQLLLTQINRKRVT